MNDPLAPGTTVAQHHAEWRAVLATAEQMLGSCYTGLTTAAKHQEVGASVHDPELLVWCWLSAGATMFHLVGDDALASLLVRAFCASTTRALAAEEASPRQVLLLRALCRTTQVHTWVAHGTKP